MIKTLDNFEIGDLLSNSLKRDKNIAALAYALTPVFQTIYKLTDSVQMFGGVPDHLLDYIAYEEAADFYDVNMSIAQKRTVIENAESIHKSKGTVAAVEDVIAPFFTRGKVREWFEYDGDPYHFQIVANEYLKNEEDIAKIFKMVNVVKRKSTRLERVFFHRMDGIIQEAVQTDANIEIHPMSGVFKCGEWPYPATLGKLFESSLQLQTESIDKSISTFKVANGFFLNSDVSPEIIKKEFSSFIQIEQAPLDYSKVEFLMANNNLMIGKFRTGSTDIVEPLQVNVSTDLTIEDDFAVSIQEELIRAGRFFVGSKEEFTILQKEFGSSLQIEQAPLDYSTVEFLMANDELMIGKFRTGSTDIAEPLQVNISTDLTIEDDFYTSIQEEMARSGQFFVGSKEKFEIIQKEYEQSIEIGMTKDMSFVEYMVAREDLHLNFLVGSKEQLEQSTRSVNSSVETTSSNDTATVAYKLAGQFYPGEG